MYLLISVRLVRGFRLIMVILFGNLVIFLIRKFVVFLDNFWKLGLVW